MDPLWAPWRLAYAAAKKPSTGTCFLCEGLGGSDDRANLVAHRTTLSAVILNRFPYTNGHLLVVPLAHKARPDELTPAETLDLQDTIRDMIRLLEKRMSPDGFNVGLNLGRAAGAGLPGHLHWHVVPRWVGDTNFMPVLGDTQVIVQSLDSLYDLITAELSGEPGASATG